MKTTRAWIGLPLLLVLLAATLPAIAQPSLPKPASPYVVAWDSPSADANGTMPLGNGEVALNAWIDPAGDLKFYIARTDSWDDNSRLAKIGAVRVRFGDGSAARTNTFHQELTVKDGSIRARYGEGDERVSLRLWVDAHRPIIYVEAQTAKPTAATAFLELWRNRQTELKTLQTSDIYARTPTTATLVEPDTVLHGLTDSVGWYHRNIKSVGPALCAKIQGLADFPRADPLLHRTFGALVAAERPLRLDDRTLQSTTGTRHIFEICVNTQHPATAEAWLTETQRVLAEARAIPLPERRAAHERWWAEFWYRSWIQITPNGKPAPRPAEAATPPLPANKLPLALGMAQDGSLRFSGTLGRMGIYETALSDAEIAALAALDKQQPAPAHPARLYSAVPEGPKALTELTGAKFQGGLTIEAWIKPEGCRGREMRIADKITAGGHNGFLFDTHPNLSLRLIGGAGQLSAPQALRSGLWQHVAATVTPTGAMKIYRDGKLIAGGSGEASTDTVPGDDAYVVSRAYALQRFIAACAGRGRYPIKYNGSLFTVPSGNNPDDADFRRWGSGYWWQNTRLPYYSMCASGDTDLLEPLFQMYARDLLPLFKFRTRKYFGHGGLYIPECIYFWGDVFTETYGWTPYEERTDKLQTSGYHKWEWVSGLELAGLALDRYEHTGDAKFLSETALPLAREVLAFFAQHYQPGPDGRLVMHPAQALETWWDSTNPMPELAGLHAITARLLALPEGVVSADERGFLKALQAKLPDLPTTVTAAGKTKLAPAAIYKNKRNIENPELYAVFPFRLFAIGKPHLDWAVEALNTRTDKGPRGWRQDDLFMAWLGQTAQARDYVATRARTKNAQSRFPAFWGPNYDWIPDQDHGSVLLAAVQSLLMQTDGRKIYLLPAWPADWNAEFKLHAPYQTTVEGKVKDGKVVGLKVEPSERAKDVVIVGGSSPTLMR